MIHFYDAQSAIA